MRLRPCRHSWLALGAVLLQAGAASAQNFQPLTDFRRVEPPHQDIFASPPFSFFSESVSDSGFVVSQASWFGPDRFKGNGRAEAPNFEPNIQADPAASSNGSFRFSIAESADVRIQASIESVGHAGSGVSLKVESPSSTVFSQCVGYFCSGITLAHESATIDTVVTLAPGTYQFAAVSNVEAQDFSGPDHSEWDVLLTTPPAVPLASGTRASIVASLLLLGLAQLHRRGMGQRSCVSVS